jgi:hypothetical protein
MNTKIVGLAPSSGRWTSEEVTAHERAATLIGAQGGEKKNSWTAILVVVGIAGAIYALSPGARHLYKHGHLPPPEPEHEHEHEHHG